MIVRWPGRIKANTESDQPWYFADVLPTLAELVGAPVPAGIDGVSVLPAILGKTQELADRFLYWEFFEGGFQQAVRWRNWKAVRLKPGQELELYDLSSDIGETRNLAAKQPKVVATMEEYLTTARTESREFPRN